MEWVSAGVADAFPQGGTKVDLAGHRLAVFRIGDDFYAIGDQCSHAEASLAEGNCSTTTWSVPVTDLNSMCGPAGRVLFPPPVRYPPFRCGSRTGR